MPTKYGWERSCHCCGKTFRVIKCRSTRAKYCSRECFYKTRPIKVMTICVICKKEHYRPPSHKTKIPTCSMKCRGLATRSPEPSSGTDYPSVRSWMRRNGRIQKCNRCGFDELKEILVVHHVDRSRINNKLENLEVLCPNCHAKEHYLENRNGWKHKSTKRKGSINASKKGKI